MKTINTLIIAVMLQFISINTFAQRFLSEVFTDNQIVKHTGIKFAENYSFLSNPNGVIEDLFMNVYEPDQSVDTLQQRPVMVFVHTGNFLPPVTNLSPTGSVEDSAAVQVCRQWAKRGFVVLAPSYRLGWNPTSTDAQVRGSSLVIAVLRGVQDIKTAVRYMRKNVAENGNTYHTDPNRVVLFGDGVGGFVVLAVATLDKFEKILIPKFINQATQQAYLDTLVTGNFEGFGGSKNVSNHPGYSSEINMVINTSGAIADTSWLSPGLAPIVSFHAVRDAYAPYNTNVVIVPTTNEPVVEVSGSGTFQRIIDQLGNNCAFDTVTFTDPYSLRAASLYNQDIPYFDAPYTINVGNGSGLFPFILPLAPVRSENGGSPWQYWDSTALAASHGSLGTYAHNNSIQSNKTMSKAKALAYIDTIMGFSMPRVYKALNLDNLAGLPNYCYKTTGIIGRNTITAEVSMYPNPAYTDVSFMLKNSFSDIKEIRLKDIAGKTVAHQMMTENGTKTATVNIAALNGGMYFADIVLHNGNLITRKLIVQ